jgi:hypothetical protein
LTDAGGKPVTALVPAVLHVKEVANGQVLDRYAVDLEHLDAVSPDGTAVRIEWAEVLRARRSVAWR